MGSRHPDHKLPLLVTNQLDDERRQEVENHVRDCTRCQEELLLLRSLSHCVRNTSYPMPPLELGWQRLKRQMNEEPAATRTPANNARWLRPALAASIVALFIESAFIGWQYHGPGTAELVPLSAQTTAHARWQVRIRETAPAGLITQFLRDQGLQIIAGPSALGIYRLAPRENQARQDSEILNQLRAHPELFSHVDEISS